jgi:hypothetical protein
MQKLSFCLAQLLFATLLSGCYYNSEEELYPAHGCATGSVTYSGDVLPIIINNCYKCHDAATNTANITLEGYANLKKFVNSGQFLGVIKHQPGFSFMPKDEPQLIECDIAKIEAWVLSGAPEN